MTLDLTISNTVNGTDTQAACGTFTWIDGNIYTTSNNTATFTIVGGAANGCDSLVTLDLTISNTVNGTDNKLPAKAILGLMEIHILHQTIRLPILLSVAQQMVAIP